MERLDATTELWRDIPGFEGLYRVSNLGNVVSVGRMIKRPKGSYYKPELLLNATIIRGYRRVSLRKGGRTIYRTVHQLVALAFLGPKPKGQDTRHLDGNPLNNRLDNLSYGTRAENVADAIRTLGLKTGEQSPNAKLSDADVQAICISDKSAKELADIYGTKVGYIHALRNRHSRTHQEFSTKDSYRRKGHDVHGSKLTEEDVNEILESSESAHALARKYGVSKTAILNIRHGKVWKHIRRP